MNGKPAFTGSATALQLAAIHGGIGVVRRLIELNANVNAPRAAKHGRTALEGAADQGRLDTVELLLKCENLAMTEGASQCQFIRAIQYAELEATEPWHSCSGHTEHGRPGMKR